MEIFLPYVLSVSVASITSDLSGIYQDVWFNKIRVPGWTIMPHWLLYNICLGFVTERHTVLIKEEEEEKEQEEEFILHKHNIKHETK